ncbi:MAG: hypothetical protein OFPI_30970 [Osedax symbiont Rs2]|nr:MAG: hypothetical protein OFPI_30970 [Osedax symbiont Rs2]
MPVWSVLVISASPFDAQLPGIMHKIFIYTQSLKKNVNMWIT